MMGRTHVVGGATAGMAVSFAAGLGAQEAAALAVGAVVTSKLPDMDAGKNAGPNHRSFPHSLIFGGSGIILAGLVLSLLLATETARALITGFGTTTWLIGPGTITFAVLGGIVGYFAHLALDAVTRKGIWLFMPGGQRVRLPKKYAVRTGQSEEVVVCGALVVVTLVLGILVFAPALGGMEFLPAP